MKKTLIAGIMCAALMAGTVIPVCAEEGNTTGGNMTVSYKEADVYVISIPQSVTLQRGSVATAQITAETMNVEPQKEVQVKVNSGIEDGKINLTLENGTDTDKTQLKVSLTDGGTGINNTTVVAKFSGQSLDPADGTGTLYFEKLPEKMKAGSWKGQLTFTVSLEDVPVDVIQ